MSSLFGSSKNFSLIPFKGERSKWHMWKLKYRDRIRIYGVLDILDGVSSIPPDGKSSYNDDDLLLRSKNEELYADLILNIQDEASFGCVSRVVILSNIIPFDSQEPFQDDRNYQS